VTWVNKEAMPHTVVDLNKGFRSKTLAKDASFSSLCNRGDYDYLCSIHPNMKGKVIGQASELMFSLSDMVRIVMIRALRPKPA